jgi:hypothetical protein
MSDKFWQDETGASFPYGVVMECRSAMAFDLVRTQVLIPANLGEKEVSEGTLLPPDKLISRSFAIADAFVDEAIRRGELRVMASFEARRAKLLIAERRAKEIAQEVLDETPKAFTQ